jgi:hypothetical protein
VLQIDSNESISSTLKPYYLWRDGNGNLGEVVDPLLGKIEFNRGYNNPIQAYAYDFAGGGVLQNSTNSLSGTSCTTAGSYNFVNSSTEIDSCNGTVWVDLTPPFTTVNAKFLSVGIIQTNINTSNTVTAPFTTAGASYIHGGNVYVDPTPRAAGTVVGIYQYSPTGNNAPSTVLVLTGTYPNYTVVAQTTVSGGNSGGYVTDLLNAPLILSAGEFLGYGYYSSGYAGYSVQTTGTSYVVYTGGTSAPSNGSVLTASSSSGAIAATPLYASGAVNAGTIGSNSVQTAVACSTSGQAIFTEPFTGSSEKDVLIYEAACVGTASYTFPTPYTYTPQVLSQSLASTVTSVSNKVVTVTGATSTGQLKLNGW